MYIEMVIIGFIIYALIGLLTYMIAIKASLIIEKKFSYNKKGAIKYETY